MRLPVVSTGAAVAVIALAVDGNIVIARAQAVGDEIANVTAGDEANATTAVVDDAADAADTGAAPWEGMPAVVPGTRGLTIEETLKMVSTETDEEFE